MADPDGLTRLLAERQGLAAGLWATMPSSVLVLSGSQQILASSPSTARLLDLDGPLVGLHLRDVLPDTGLAAVAQQALEAEAPPRHCSVRLPGRTLRASVAALPGSGGLLITLDEREEAERLEADLRHVISRLDGLVEGTGDCIFTLDLNGVLRSANLSFERLTGYSRDELLGTHVARLLSGSERGQVAERIGALLGGAGSVAYEMALLARGGERIMLEVSDHLLFRAGRPIGVQAIARNVTERRRAEEHARRAQALEVAARLAGGVAHDLNNLLTVILGRCDLMLHRYAAVPGLAGDMRQIHKASESAAAIAAQLLSFSRGSLVRPVAFDLAALVTGLLPMMSALLGEQSHLVLQLPPEGAWVRADPSQIERVLMNLVANAGDAMPQGGGVTINIQPAGATDADPSNPDALGRTLMSIADTGVGMTEQVRSRLFEPFFTTKGRGKGTGLGLAVVYGIVTQAGGDVTVRSEPAKGTTVEVRLPATLPSPPDHVEKPAALPPATLHPPEPATILLVEDDADVRSLSAAILSEAGYLVAPAACAEEALTIAAQVRPHALVTDVRMPGMSGPELASTLDARFPSLPVLFVTGDAEGAVVPAGAHLLRKPFSRADLVGAVLTLLSGP